MSDASEILSRGSSLSLFSGFGTSSVSGGSESGGPGGLLPGGQAGHAAREGRIAGHMEKKGSVVTPNTPPQMKPELLTHTLRKCLHANLVGFWGSNLP